jgi:hypothetical protein
MAAMFSVTIQVNFPARRVKITAVNAADKEEYTYVGQSFKRLKEILDKVAATYEDSDLDSFEQNVATDGSLLLLPGP